MIQKHRIAEEVEKTLQAFDNDPPLEPNPFLLTRIRAGMEISSKKTAKGFAVRIGLGQVIIVFIILLNLVTLSYTIKTNADKTLQKELIQQFETDLQFDRSQTIF
ncbi:MAG TPA: hypothetical protein PKY55_11430 [bacterium]|nr:hypothetical protein [bacterium]